MHKYIDAGGSNGMKQKLEGRGLRWVYTSWEGNQWGVSELCVRTFDLMCHTCKYDTLGQMSGYIAPTRI